MKPVVLLDVDGVVADCSTAIHCLAERIFERSLPAPPWSSYDCDEAMGLLGGDGERFWSEARAIDWAHEIELYPEAVAGVARLREVADVAFCTSPWKGNVAWCHHRQELLHRHFPDVDVIQTNAKHRVLGDFLVDDKFEQASHPDSVWVGLLWTHPYNEQHRPPLSRNWLRVHGWDDVIREVAW